MLGYPSCASLDGFPYLGIVGLDDKWNIVSRPEEVVPMVGVFVTGKCPVNEIH
jgi:hypothetical protein